MTAFAIRSAWFALLLIGAVPALAVPWQAPAGNPLAEPELAVRPVDFNRDVKPILTSRCFLCHGPDESSREADLRLDQFSGATGDLGGYAAIVPGKPEESELIRRISSTDESEIMPPAGHGAPLTATEQQVLRTWVASGAKYDVHWSYAAPSRPVTPDFVGTEFASWIRNPIDSFVLQRMREHQLTPADPVDRRLLARRVSLDLTGLPPTPEQADAFAADSDPAAYEQLVDELLASDAYGEHWAAMWLDMARYADSAGYAEDRARTIWAYRDYVIRSYQANQPYDEFTVQQIAGDLLPHPEADDLIATAFHRNTLTNSEGGTDDEEFRVAAVVDRTNTTMAVWMGTTMGCAQCHTHKYDPISQTEYFQVFAILNSTSDNDQPGEQPVYSVFNADQQHQQEQLRKQIAEVQQDLTALESADPVDTEARLAAEQAVWEAELLPGLDQLVAGKRVRVSLSGDNRVLQLAEVQVFSGDQNVALTGQASQSSTYPDGDASHANDDNPSGVFAEKSVSHTNHQRDPWWQVEWPSAQSIDRIVIWNRTDGDLYQRLDGLEVQIFDADDNLRWSRRFEKAQREAQEIACQMAPVEIMAALRVSLPDRSAEQAALVRDYFLARASSEKQLQDQLSQLNGELEAVQPETTVPVLKELEKGRTTHIHIRGSHRSLGDEVQRGVPVAFHSIGTTTPNRLDLAHWLVDRNNPLTARVAVNRFWQRLFGVGLVRTSEDFGAQGDQPSHPELLDYLAVEFMESGWDNRAILKQIVMSATYQQDARVTAEKRLADPDNRWLARGPRFRISAEMVRDQALAAAGLLSRKMYGPPVKPPAPELGLKAAFSGNLSWTASTGEDRYRRAIYTNWRRSSPYPSMETFDVSNREVCDLRRIATNTPLQALVTLNDEVYVEAAQALGKRMMASGSTPREQATAGFRRILIRPPSTDEVEALVALYQQTSEHFALHPDDAAQLATDFVTGIPDPDLDPREVASWTTVANVLLNLDEVFLKP